MCEELRVCTARVACSGAPRPISEFATFTQDGKTWRRGQCPECLRELRRERHQRRRDQRTRTALYEIADAKTEREAVRIGNAMFGAIRGAGLEEYLKRFLEAEHYRSAYSATKAMRGMTRFLYSTVKIVGRRSPERARQVLDRLLQKDGSATGCAAVSSPVGA